MFLHGAAEYGSPLEKITKNGIPNLIKQFELYSNQGELSQAARIVATEYITVSPQNDNPYRWNSEVLYKLLDEVEATVPAIDTKRVYLTGISMGGHGTWSFAIYSNAIKKKNRFAAIVPICGWYDQFEKSNLDSIAIVPTWVFHGAKDDIIPEKYSATMVKWLKEKHGHDNIQYTVYPKAGHDSWTETYENTDLYSWMNKHKLDK